MKRLLSDLKGRKIQIMDLKRSLSSNAHPHSNRSDNNGYKEDLQKMKFGGLLVDITNETVQKHRRKNKHLSTKLKHSQPIMDRSGSATPNNLIGIIMFKNTLFIHIRVNYLIMSNKNS